jgi:outer membrane protein OmpA-like peptidoglycan-associated protein
MRAAAAGDFLVGACLLGGPVWAQSDSTPSEGRESARDDGDEADDEDDDAPEPLPVLTAGGRIVVQADPLFKGMTADITPRGLELAQGVRAAMEGFTGKVTLTVYWSAGGTRAEAIAVTKRRAESLAQHIRGFGIDHARVVTVGRGFANPVASNDTFEGQVANRRVEIVSDSRAKPVAPAREAKPAPEAKPARVEAPEPQPEILARPPAPATDAGPPGSAGKRVEAKLEQAVRLAEGLRDAVKQGAADCPEVSRSVVKWVGSDDKALDALGDEIGHIFDHELNYKYSAAQRQAMTRYAEAMKAASASLEACGEVDGLTPAAVAAIDGLESVDNLLYEPRGVHADPLCRRFTDLERDVRDDPERLKGAPADGGFASTRTLPDAKCEYSGAGVICEVSRHRDVVSAAEPFVALEQRISACHFSREESEMDQLHHRGGARNQRVWLHYGMAGRQAVTCHLRLVPTTDDGFRIVIVVDRARL